MNPEVVEKAGRFPEAPGVYIFSGADGQALYVGKAANLRARVRSYLKPGGDGRRSIRFLEGDHVRPHATDDTRNLIKVCRDRIRALE